MPSAGQRPSVPARALPQLSPQLHAVHDRDHGRCRMSRNRAKGTSWESRIVAYLQTCGWPYAERRALNGAKDRGDIAGLPAVVIEAKSAARVELAGWLDEANKEAENDGADLGVVWFKRRGKTSPADGFVLMDGETFVDLLMESGYGSRPSDDDKDTAA